MRQVFIMSFKLARFPRSSRLACSLSLGWEAGLCTDAHDDGTTFAAAEEDKIGILISTEPQLRLLPVRPLY